jgi:hypothetical protein
MNYTPPVDLAVLLQPNALHLNTSITQCTPHNLTTLAESYGEYAKDPGPSHVEANALPCFAALQQWCQTLAFCSGLLTSTF